MQKKLLILFFIAFTYGSFAQNKTDYNADLIPSNLKSRAGAVIRNMETTVDMRTQDNVILYVKKAVTILNKSADERGALSIYYNKSTVVKSIKGLLLDAAGNTVGKFNQANFSDESASSDYSLFEDARIKSFAPSILSYPYTVVYEYEIRYRQNLIIPEWYANPYPDVAVEKNSYTFICKPEDKIRIKSYNYKSSPEESITEKTKSLTWSVKNLNAFKYEPYAPDPDSYLTYVKIAPEQFTYYGFKGTYNNWNELGKWVYNDLIKKRQTLSPAAISDVNKLVEGITDDKEKAKKIYEFMQKKTRYISVQVGIGGFQPFPASEVDRLSYGDCKALVNYTQSLLKAVGINSMYCVVNAGSLKKNMDIDFASMDQGNHIILCVPFKNDTTWLECTSQTTPFGYLGTFTDDRTVFACTEEGGGILRTPALNTTTNLSKRKAELTINDEGDVNGNMQTNVYGSQYDNYERIINEPYKEQLKHLKEAYDIDNINFSDVKFIQKKEGINPVTTESLKLKILKYTPKTSNRIYLIPNIFNKASSIPESKNRNLPVYVNRGYSDEDEIIYELPAGYALENKPEDVTIKTLFGTYEMAIKSDGKKLIYKRKLSINSGIFDANKYVDIVAFFSNINGFDNSKITLKSN
ncbi:DUF3857 domain-containing protein [Pedobacter frigoris]|uniref:DUF3857 domain-containing protein n=1 Tax=Pedobacter frigoris TaxID=2571272 RepID=A0A4U1CTH2_9SPHI|nr:DUF3857 domain-containing protein [Pedobacter frigoris]TKC09259.1 DUF3857 domain-containing protein [Pedobacter frigoris]